LPVNAFEAERPGAAPGSWNRRRPQMSRVCPAGERLIPWGTLHVRDFYSVSPVGIAGGAVSYVFNPIPSGLSGFLNLNWSDRPTQNVIGFSAIGFFSAVVFWLTRQSQRSEREESQGVATTATAALRWCGGCVLRTPCIVVASLATHGHEPPLVARKWLPHSCHSRSAVD
jgi:hypothetical protein